jgi:hypothetical protein
LSNLLRCSPMAITDFTIASACAFSMPSCSHLYRPPQRVGRISRRRNPPTLPSFDNFPERNLTLCIGGSSGGLRSANPPYGPATSPRCSNSTSDLSQSLHIHGVAATSAYPQLRTYRCAALNDAKGRKRPTTASGHMLRWARTRHWTPIRA